MKKIITLLVGCIFACSLQASYLEDKSSLNNSLSGAIQNLQFKKAEGLLSKGAEINGKNSLGDTILHTVAKSNNAKAAAFLIKKGANVNLRNKNKIIRRVIVPAPQTPLHIAVLSNSVAVAKLLLEAGADVNAKAIIRGVFGQREKSPLSMARSLKMKRLLKKHGGKKHSKRYNP